MKEGVRYSDADARLRAAALALVDYSNRHGGVVRSGSSAFIELREAWYAAERKREHVERMRQYDRE